MKLRTGDSSHSRRFFGFGQGRATNVVFSGPCRMTRSRAANRVAARERGHLIEGVFQWHRLSSCQKPNLPKIQSPEFFRRLEFRTAGHGRPLIGYVAPLWIGFSVYKELRQRFCHPAQTSLGFLRPQHRSDPERVLSNRPSSLR